MVIEEDRNGFDAVQEQVIMNGRGGVMPTWAARMDPETLKAMAVYIHANAGGGEDEGAAATAP